MSIIFTVYIPASTLVAWTNYAYWSTLFQPRKGKHDRRTLHFLLLFLTMLALAAFRYTYPNLVTILIQLTLLVFSYPFYEGKFWEHIVWNLWYVMFVLLMEVSVTFFYVFLHSVFSTSTNFYFPSQESFWGQIIVTIMMVVTEVAFFKKMIPLIKDTFAFLPKILPFELLLPIVLLQVFAVKPWSNENMGISIVPYCIGCMACYPLLLHGISHLRIQERKRVLQEQHLELLTQQMKDLQELNHSIQSIRRWNHDMENHLQSIRYLMEKEQYENVERYIKELLETE